MTQVENSGYTGKAPRQIRQAVAQYQEKIVEGAQ
jgi:hypothetical protein